VECAVHVIAEDDALVKLTVVGHVDAPKPLPLGVFHVVPTPVMDHVVGELIKLLVEVLFESKAPIDTVLVLKSNMPCESVKVPVICRLSNNCTVPFQLQERPIAVAVEAIVMEQVVDTTGFPDNTKVDADVKDDTPVNAVRTATVPVKVVPV
jgi:hypothetical protein